MSANDSSRPAPDPRLLLAIPVATYALAYLYLVGYHGRIDLWRVEIHESGRLTLLETTFYASHFLGHIPVLITVALVFAGSWLMVAPPPVAGPALRFALLAAGLGLLLAAATGISLWHFGSEDTLGFLLQRKQRPDLFIQGGSWNLHLPSTVLQFLLVPVVVWAARRIFARPVVWSRRGLGLVGAAALTAVAMTWLANDRTISAMIGVWSDPRYLAHSVRELATFPLICYPIPLAVLLRGERPSGDRRSKLDRRDLMVLLAASVFLIGLTIQVAESLAHDVGSLAQHPGFARGGRLTIPYLLAFHFFEHFLDSIFFALVTLIAVQGPILDGDFP